MVVRYGRKFFETARKSFLGPSVEVRMGDGETSRRVERFDANHCRGPLTPHRLNSAVSREVTWPT